MIGAATMTNHTMLRRSLGQSGISVSAIGLGCMGMSEFYGASDEAGNLATLDRAMELGIDFLDTADAYGPDGDNEILLSRFLKGKRDRVILATKFGIRRVTDPDARPIDNSPSYIRAACEASLKRLGTSYIDLYYMHRRSRDVPLADSVGAMAELVWEGKVRAIGLSEVSVETLGIANAIHPIAAVQSEYSLWSRELEVDIIPAVRAIGASVVPYSPLGRGALAGRFSDPEELEIGDFRRSVPRFSRENFDRNKLLISRLKTIADDAKLSMAQLALAWVLAKGDDMIPIPGTRQINRLEENADAVGVKLSPNVISELNTVFDPALVHGDRTSAVGRSLIGN
jgi:aryl-alcohol dehydrogenase-like predicted oxidoreductase